MTSFAVRYAAPMRSRSLLVILTAALALGLTACSAESKELPDVTGHRLDDAHNKLKDAGFERFEDSDAINDREPAWDANWVVLEQSPGGGDSVQIDTTIKLSVAKPEDPGVRDRLPEGSPVALEMEQRDRQRAIEKQEQAAEQRREQVKARAEVNSFVEKNDALVRNNINAISDLPGLADSIRAVGVVTLDAGVRLIDIEKALGVSWEALEDAPEQVNSCADRAQEAIRSFQQASDTLLTAEGAAAEGSLARFTQLYNPAVTKYNAGITCLYKETGISAPTV